MTVMKVSAVGWLTTAGAVSAWQAVVTIYGDFLGLYGLAAALAALATIVTSLAILGVAARRTVRWIRDAGHAVRATLRLDEKFDRHEEEMRSWRASTVEQIKGGDERMSRIEGALQMLATSERAAVRGAVEALTEPTAPRPARRTDPIERTGWRE